MPKLNTIEMFTEMHRALEQRTFNYIDYPRRNYRKVPASVRSQMNRSQTSYLHAHNFDARIRMATLVAAAVDTLFAGTAGDGKQHFVTGVPERFALPLSEAGSFDCKSLQDWTLSAMNGINFIAMVEFAYYPGWPHGKPTVAPHFHAVTWGITYSRLNRQLASVRRANNSLIPHCKSVDISQIDRTEARGKMLYAMKFPHMIYKPYPLKNKFDPKTEEWIDQTGRYGQSKSDMRTSDLTVMCEVLRDQYIDRMLFGGGAGIEIVNAICKSAHIRYAEDETPHA